MRMFLLRALINAVAIAITASVLPGITVFGGGGTLIFIGVVFGLVNAVIKPIVTVLTCPFTCLTLGLFILVINGCMLQLTATLVGDRLYVDSLMWAIIGGIIMSILGMLLEWALGIRKDDNNDDNRRKFEYRKL